MNCMFLSNVSVTLYLLNECIYDAAICVDIYKGGSVLEKDNTHYHHLLAQIITPNFTNFYLLYLKCSGAVSEGISLKNIALNTELKAENSNRFSTI